jgi:hypothetical protein
MLPHKVDVPIPTTGIGSRLITLIGWCREHIAADDWDCHAFPERGGDKSSVQDARFYFLNETDAEAFRRRLKWTPKMGPVD